MNLLILKGALASLLVALLAGCESEPDVSYEELENEIATLQEDYDALQSELNTLDEEFGSFRDAVSNEIGLE